jgi:hypothetical protein
MVVILELIDPALPESLDAFLVQRGSPGTQLTARILSKVVDGDVAKINLGK